MNFGYQNEPYSRYPYTPEDGCKHNGERKWLYRIRNNETGQYVPYDSPWGSVHYDFASPEEARAATQCFSRAKYAVVRIEAVFTIDSDEVDPPSQDELDAWHRELEFDKRIKDLSNEKFPAQKGLTIRNALQSSYMKAEFELSQRLIAIVNDEIKREQ